MNFLSTCMSLFWSTNMAAMTSRFNIRCVIQYLIQYYSDQCSQGPGDEVGEWLGAFLRSQLK